MAELNCSRADPTLLVQLLVVLVAYLAVIPWPRPDSKQWPYSIREFTDVLRSFRSIRRLVFVLNSAMKDNIEVVSNSAHQSS